MAEEFLFFNYLLEKYATYRGKSARDILKEWDRCGITQTIYDSYWQYHTERIENAYADIDALLQRKG